MAKNYTIHLNNEFVDGYFGDFTTQLSTPLDLKGTWTCTVTFYLYPTPIPQTNYVFICSDICENSFVGETSLPALTLNVLKIKKKNYITSDFITPFKVKLRKKHISHIRIYLTDEKGHLISFNGRQPPGADKRQSCITLLLEQNGE